LQRLVLTGGVLHPPQGIARQPFFHLRWHPSHHGLFWYFHTSGHHAAGSHDGSLAHPGTLKHHCTYTDDCLLLDGTALQQGEVPDGDVVCDDTLAVQ
jgi:hypothetical protein